MSTWISLDDHEEAFARKEAELESLRQENSRLREALEFYADPENYHGRIGIHRARAALNPPKS